MDIDRLPPSKREWSYLCDICRLPILTNCHSRHTDASGNYHIACETGQLPKHASARLPRIAGER